METLVTRSEHTRSLADADKYRALELLRRVGLLLPLTDLETIHGRVRHTDEGDDWHVDPSFSNGGNDTGNRNLNGRSTLYTSSEEVARAFGEARARNNTHSYIVETHEIESWDTDAVVLSGNGFLSFEEVEDEEYDAALKCLAIDYSAGSPVGFDDRENLNEFRSFVQDYSKGYIDYGESVDIAHKLGISEKLSLHLSSARNAQLMAMKNPAYLSRLFLRHSHDIVGSKASPMNMEYVESYFRNAHIVGEAQRLNSATLKRIIGSVSLYDLDKVATRKDIQKGKIDMQRRLGLMATTFSKVFATESLPSHPLLRLMEDPHVKPEAIVSEAAKLDGFDNIFAARTGVWEGYTLAEHTETVLRNFDENYADKIPVQLLLPMRLAILAHDIGKPIASQAGQIARDQLSFNIKFADRLFEQLGLDKARRLLLTTILGSGASLAAKVHIEKVDAAERALNSLIRARLGEVFGDDMVADRHVNEYKELCKILVVCDGGAYTSMATTRMDDGSVFRNAASFNASFARPVGFGRRGIRLIERGDVSAQHDLTPQI